MLKCISYIFILFIALQIVVNVNIPKSMPFFTYRESNSNFYSMISKKVTKNSFQFILHLSHNLHFGKVNGLADLAEFMSLEVFLISKNTLQFIFRNANETRFELPCEEPFPCHKYPENIVTDFNMSNLEYDYELTLKERPFSFTISRKKTKEVIFTTLNRQIVFKENYAEISTDLPSDNLFGLGERTTNFKLKSGTYTLYNKDLYGELEDGSGNGKNRYGSHPMYLMRERSANWHISYLRNSFPMDVIVQHDTSVLTYKIAGGVLDFTFFLGNENPETVTQMYHDFLGGYSMPPFWAMGFHQCRWGYKNLNMIRDVLNNYKNNDIPLDTIWTDIDYMQDYMPFTVDNNRFNLKEFKNTLSEFKKKYIMIIEPSMGTKWPSYEYLTRGKSKGIFIKNKEGDYLINKVWPGKCHFFDYFNPDTKSFWDDALSTLKEKIDYSGIWLDMNEIAAFNAGQMNMQDWTLPCNDDNKYPYIPGNKPFETATICPNAVHYKGMTHIQLHNYYPNMQAKLTHDFLEKMIPDQFPFVLTRANAPGIGKYAAHWSGDNYGRFAWYKLSISEVLNFNLFGGPMVGADICGFGEDTPEVLCAKWYQLGSLYPFSRSHAHLDSYRKEPYAMGKTLLETTRKSLQFRYSILKYYYSLFMLNKGRGTIFRPLFFEFYNDPGCLESAYIDNFFMIGSSLLVVPNLHDDNNENNTTTPAYFPYGDWFDLRDNSRVPKRDYNPQLITVRTTLNEMPTVYLRSGKTIFTNDIEKVRNSFDLDNNYNILIALQKDEKSGKYFSYGKIPAIINYDSKKNINNCISNNCFINIITSVENTSNNSSNIKISFSKAQYYNEDYSNNQIKINKLVIYGIKINSKHSINSSSLDNFLGKGKYEYQYVNDFCFVMKFKADLIIKKEELSILLNITTG